MSNHFNPKAAFKNSNTDLLGRLGKLHIPQAPAHARVWGVCRAGVFVAIEDVRRVICTEE